MPAQENTLTHQTISPAPPSVQADDHVVDLRDRPTTTDSARSTVAVVGLGYVGLPTALSLRQTGRRVIGLDVSGPRLQAIEALAVDLVDHDRRLLEREVRQAAGTAPGEAGLELTSDPSRLTAADCIIICVPTPVSDELIPDLGALRSACASVVEHVRPGQTIVLTSTSYVGCTRELLHEPLTRRGLRPGVDVHVVFSPERIDPGVPDHRPLTTPRVLGGFTQDCAEHARRALEGTSSEIHVVSCPEVAEFTKLLENTFRAVNIAFINEMADVAHELGLPVAEIVDAASTKPYGFMRFMPGPGVGGHCIPCDPHYLLWQLRARRHPTPVVEAAMTGIAVRPRKVVSRIREELADRGVPMAAGRVHLVGVAYKPGVADLRESPALEVLAECARMGAEVSYSDALIPHLELADRTLHSVDLDRVEADILVVHTLHPGQESGTLDWTARFPVVLDTTFKLRRNTNCVVV